MGQQSSRNDVSHCFAFSAVRGDRSGRGDAKGDPERGAMVSPLAQAEFPESQSL